MGHHTAGQLTRYFGITYVLLFFGLSYFAIYPSWKQGELVTLVVTLFWMLILAAIVATYALAIVFLSGEDS